LVIWHDVEQDGVRLAFEFQKISNENLKFGSRAFVQLRGIDERSALSAGEASNAIMATGSWATRLKHVKWERVPRLFGRRDSFLEWLV
jgi:hypothetical protein